MEGKILELIFGKFEHFIDIAVFYPHFRHAPAHSDSMFVKCPAFDGENGVRTTGLAGGLLCPYKGLLPACARKAH